MQSIRKQKDFTTIARKKFDSKVKGSYEEANEEEIKRLVEKKEELDKKLSNFKKDSWKGSHAVRTVVKAREKKSQARELEMQILFDRNVELVQSFDNVVKLKKAHLQGKLSVVNNEEEKPKDESSLFTDVTKAISTRDANSVKAVVNNVGACCFPVDKEKELAKKKAKVEADSTAAITFEDYKVPLFL